MDNNTSFISRIIKGVKDGTSLRPAVTPESISSVFIENAGDISGSKNNFDIRDPSSKYLSSQSLGSSANDFKSDLNNSEIRDIQEKKTLGKRGEYPYYYDKERQPQTTKDERKSGYYNLKNEGYLMGKNVDLANSAGPFSGKEKKPHLFSPQNSTGKSISDKSDEVLSKNADIERERGLLSWHIMQRFQKNEMLKRRSESTITINIGKITVRAVNNNNSTSPYRINVNESKQSKKLSLNDYLRKRSEKDIKVE